MEVQASLVWSLTEDQPGLSTASWKSGDTEMAAVNWISVSHSRVGLNGPADSVKAVLRQALELLDGGNAEEPS